MRADVSASPTGRLLQRGAPALARTPGAARLFYAILRRSPRAHRATGTVQVTAVGMFGGGGGFGIAPPSVPSLTVVVGGLERRPVALGQAVEVRDVLDLTVTVDHNVIDGAPAARFVGDLRRLLTSSSLVDPEVSGSG